MISDVGFLLPSIAHEIGYYIHYFVMATAATRRAMRNFLNFVKLLFDVADIVESGKRPLYVRHRYLFTVTYYVIIHKRLNASSYCKKINDFIISLFTKVVNTYFNQNSLFV